MLVTIKLQLDISPNNLSDLNPAIMQTARNFALTTPPNKFSEGKRILLSMDTTQQFR